MDQTNKEKVREVLVEHVGRENAITSTEIGEKADIPNGNGNSNVRNSVRELTNSENDLPIGSCNDGYFIIETYDELCEYTEGLDERICKIRERQKNTRHSFFRRQN